MKTLIPLFLDNDYKKEISPQVVEIKEKYEHLEIIKDRNQDAFGIGVLFVKY
jgi:hypothetical protein